ncbi:MAG: GxxExxY protein [Vicinamibacterales bacterium]
MDTPPTRFRDRHTFLLLGAAMAVSNELGAGFLEPVYHHALRIELRRRGVPFRSEVQLPVHYKGERLPVSYRVDFVCYDEVLVELKALPRLGEIEVAQVLNYLRASGLHCGLLINFGRPKLEYRRIVLDLPPDRDPVRNLGGKGIIRG